MCETEINMQIINPSAANLK